MHLSRRQTQIVSLVAGGMSDNRVHIRARAAAILWVESGRSASW
jgi:hypothetical protein